MKSIKIMMMAVLGLALGGLVLGRAKAQVFEHDAPILVPTWQPGEAYEPAGAPVIGHVSSTYDEDDPSSYVETWRWSGEARPALYAVQPGKIPDGDGWATQTGYVHDGIDGCASPPPAMEGTSHEVYNALQGEVPARVGTMIVDSDGAEHWYLSDRFRYAGQDGAALIVRRDASARVLPEHTDHYIRVDFGK